MLSCSKKNETSATVEGSFNARHFEAFNALPGRKRWIGRKLEFETTAKNIEHIIKNVQDITFDLDIQARIADIERKRREEQALREAKTALPDEAFRFPFKTEPFEHQKKAFFLSKDKPVFAYFMEMGTGKTKTVIDVAAYKYSVGQIDAVLIVAPNGVHRQWASEQIPMHLPDWVPREIYSYRPNTPNKVMKAVRELLEKRDCLRIMLMNVEAFSTENGAMYAREFLSKTKTFFVLDESTRIKTPGAKRTKNIIRVGGMAENRAILSGAPVTKGVEDLYAQLKFLDPDILGFSSFYTFRNHFCNMGGYESRQIVGYRNIPELTQRLEGHSFRVTKSECLDLPEKIYVEREVELSEDQRRIYKQLRDEFFVQLQSGQVLTAPLALTRLLRMQQVIGGFLPDENGKAVRLVKTNPRIEAVREIIDECQGKVAVWARFHEDIDWLMEDLSSYGAVKYDGRLSNKERDYNKEKFLTDDRVRVFVGQPASAGIGLNLTVANTVIYYSNTFDADSRWQSEDRFHRIGMKGSVTYIDLVAPKTIDSKIIKALRHKKNIADLVTNAKALLSDDPIV